MNISFIATAFLGFVLFVSTILFLIAFSIPRYRQSNVFQLISGFVEVIMANAFFFMLLLLLVASFPSQVTIAALYSVGGIGLLQLLYVVPRSLVLRRQQRWSRMKGVIIGAVIVALLNGGCWVLLAR
jgi:hypothetical protein